MQLTASALIENLGILEDLGYILQHSAKVKTNSQKRTSTSDTQQERQVAFEQGSLVTTYRLALSSPLCCDTVDESACYTLTKMSLGLFESKPELTTSFQCHCSAAPMNDINTELFPCVLTNLFNCFTTPETIMMLQKYNVVMLMI